MVSGEWWLSLTMAPGDDNSFHPTTIATVSSGKLKFATTKSLLAMTWANGHFFNSNLNCLQIAWLIKLIPIF